VERRSDHYRWSLAHPGGGYPILRITARFLHVDHSRIVVGFRTLSNGIALMCDDPKIVQEADVWQSSSQRRLSVPRRLARPSPAPLTPMLRRSSDRSRQSADDSWLEDECASSSRYLRDGQIQRSPEQVVPRTP